MENTIHYLYFVHDWERFWNTLGDFVFILSCRRIAKKNRSYILTYLHRKHEHWALVLCVIPRRWNCIQIRNKREINSEINFFTFHKKSGDETSVPWNGVNVVLYRHFPKGSFFSSITLEDEILKIENMILDTKTEHPCSKCP